MYLSLLLLVVLVGVTYSKLADYHQRGCEPGWSQVGNKCFKLIAAPNTWTVLDKACANQGSQLASISSAAENEAIRRIAGGREIYIGGLSYALGPWSWADLTPFGVYRNWRNGEWFDNCCRVPPAPGVCERNV